MGRSPCDSQTNRAVLPAVTVTFSSTSLNWGGTAQKGRKGRLPDTHIYIPLFRNALLSHHRCFPKVVVKGSHVLEGIFIVVVMDACDLWFIVRRNCLEKQPIGVSVVFLVTCCGERTKRFWIRTLTVTHYFFWSLVLLYIHIYLGIRIASLQCCSLLLFLVYLFGFVFCTLKLSCVCVCVCVLG